jgi:hypothetical protein
LLARERYPDYERLLRNVQLRIPDTGKGGVAGIHRQAVRLPYNGTVVATVPAAELETLQPSRLPLQDLP